VTVLPGEQKKIIIEYQPATDLPLPQVSVKGWNFPEQFIGITK
jgi:hypothetical protein